MSRQSKSTKIKINFFAIPIDKQYYMVYNIVT